MRDFHSGALVMVEDLELVCLFALERGWRVWRWELGLDLGCEFEAPRKGLFPE